MTPESLNLALAGYFEPKPRLKGALFEISTVGVWQVLDLDDRAGRRWRPRDFINNHFCRDLCQSRLLELGWVIRLERLQGDGHNTYTELECESETQRRAFTVKGEREKLMAEALHRAVGLKEE